MEITITALSPISHGEYVDGVDAGNIMMFRKMPFVRNGNVYNIPVLSGNSFRGAIRRLLAREYIERTGLNGFDDLIPGRFDKFYIALANGGALDKNLDVGINPEKLKDLRELLPLLSVFGSALYKYMLSGMFNMGFGVLKCAELGTGKISVIDLITEVGLVRHVDREYANLAEAKPMPYTTECIVAGAQFDLSVSFAPQATELEIACVKHGFNLLKTVGGKSAVGFGQISIGDKLDDAQYVDWLNDLDDEHVEKINQFIGEL